MAEIISRSSAGTLESSDAYVELEPGRGGIELRLDSIVINQFGDAIKSVVLDVLRENEVKNAKITVMDRGALDCVIRARVETAVLRGKGEL